MKKLSLLLSLTVLCGSLAFAQDAASQSASPSANTASGASSVQGCLSGSDGNYMLTQDRAGTTFKLIGSETQLKKHVGHEVAVTGQSTGSEGSSASAADQGQAQPSTGGSDSNTIQVTNVRMVSKQCGPAGSTPQQ